MNVILRFSFSAPLIFRNIDRRMRIRAPIGRFLDQVEQISTTRRKSELMVNADDSHPKAPSPCCILSKDTTKRWTYTDREYENANDDSHV